MYNSGNSSKNVTGSSVVDGSLENADYADNAISGDKVDGGIISNFQSTGIDDRLPTGKVLTLSTTGADIDGSVTCDGFTSTGIDDNATSTAITIDSAENVGIGTAPEAWSGWKALDVGTTGAFVSGSLTTRSMHNSYYNGGWKYKTTQYASKLDFEGNGDVNIDVAASGTADTAITFTTGFSVLNSGRARAPNGLLFGTDTAAANALDDYEEGTWTPVVANGTLTNNFADYTKIGRQVFLNFYISDLSDLTTASNITITGLPFTGVNASNGTCLHEDFSADNSLSLYFNGTELKFAESSPAGSWRWIKHSDLTSGMHARCSITYMV